MPNPKEAASDSGFAPQTDASAKLCILQDVLVGTHAHEMMSMVAQLMSRWDNQVPKGSKPVALSALLAHILFLTANGKLENATALADTFGTEAFIAAAFAQNWYPLVMVQRTRLPKEFIEDVTTKYAATNREGKAGVSSAIAALDLLSEKGPT